MGRREWYRSFSKGEKEIPGCMSGMLHFFDFHRILFTPSSSGSGGRAAQVSSPQQLHQYPSQHKGVEAPRNSLELDEAAAATAASTASALAEEDYGIPIGIQVKAAPSLLKKQNKKKKKNLLQLVEEEKRMTSQSETPRTPNVVARLMGLEILADGAMTPTLGSKSQVHSPRNSMKKKAMNESPPRRQPLQKRDTNLLPIVRTEMGYRSLPDTPRASAERSREADPRLSLVINKENIHNNRDTYLYEAVAAVHSLPPSPTGGYMNKPRRSKENSLKFQDENKSPRSYYNAREIVKQVKENIHCRRENSNAGGGTEDRLNKSRRTRPAVKRVTVENIDTEQYFSAKPSTSTSPPPPSNIFFDPPKPQVQPKPPRPQPALPSKAREHVEAASKCKKASYEKFTERLKRQPSQSETATQSDSLLSRITPPVPSSSSPSISAAFPQKHSSKDAPHRSPPLASPERVRPTQEQQSFLQRQRVHAKERDPEFLYVKSILERGGIMSTATAQVRWYSPSLPIDPFVFHQLELDLPLFHGHDPLRHRCNRKLLFHLVGELLSDILSGSLKPHKKISKELLLDRVWSQIRSFPLADCQVIEDIDALVAGDLAEARFRRLLGHPLVAAEAERVALEIEEDVFDSIVGEAAATLALCSTLQQ